LSTLRELCYGEIMTWNEWQTIVQQKTEAALTWNKRRRLRKKAKQKKKNQILDWIEALLWAALFVLILNQYFLQAYAIPSGSMLDTIQLEDRMFVNKLIYGPELLPGIGKLPGFAEPRRGDIIIFENPNYEQDMGRKVGAGEQLFHRLVYMLTFSLVNLDVKPDGEAAHHFLVKRLIGVPGDRVRQVNGRMQIMPAAETAWHTEQELIETPLGREYLRKDIPYDLYPACYQYLKIGVYKSQGLPSAPLSTEDTEQLKRLEQSLLQKTRRNILMSFMMSDYEMTAQKNILYFKIRPYDPDYFPLWAKYSLGWYISPTRLFPMGDNRDESYDARYFHPVRLDKLLGKAAFRFWPLSRIGVVE
jgi:signal peptidase I